MGYGVEGLLLRVWGFVLRPLGFEKVGGYGVRV